ADLQQGPCSTAGRKRVDELGRVRLEVPVPLRLRQSLLVLLELAAPESFDGAPLRVVQHIHSPRVIAGTPERAPGPKPAMGKTSLRSDRCGRRSGRWWRRRLATRR